MTLPDDLFREAKAQAARKGISLKRLFSQALERELSAPQTAGSTRPRVKLPLVRSKQPGSLKLTNAQIEELLA